MPFTPEDIARVQKHLENRLKPCPMCSAHAWEIQAEPMALATWTPPNTGIEGGDVNHRGPIMPVVALACGQCGYLLMYPWNHIMRSQGRG